MQQPHNKVSAVILGFFIFAGLSTLGYLLGNAAIKYKQYERSITVKGLAEQEYGADIVIWPIQFTLTGRHLAVLYQSIEKNSAQINTFLQSKGIAPEEISFSPPSIIDKSAQQYGNEFKAEFRYNAIQTITVYSKNIAIVRSALSALSELGKQGIVFSHNNYEAQIEYLFTRLNEVKPKMIEEATKNAREVAEKFAADSRSTLGKIKKASQGQFSINMRDKNNPHIKKVRVVATVQYYLSD